MKDTILASFFSIQLKQQRIKASPWNYPQHQKGLFILSLNIVKIKSIHNSSSTFTEEDIRWWVDYLY